MKNKQSLQVIKNIYKKVSNFCDFNWLFYILLIFNSFFVFINIYKPILVFGLFFLVVNIFFLIFLSKKKKVALIFFLYPLARVLKLSFLPTSLLTILIVFLYVFFFFSLIASKQKLSRSRTLVVVLFVLYLLFTLCTSLINIYGFEFQRLISYYIYLSFPVICFIAIKEPSEISMNKSIILLCASYLYGMILTIVFYKIIPDGPVKLIDAGVNVFDMGIAGIRYSPLTDDPNYGSALFVLISSLFFVSKKNVKEALLGYSLISISSILSILSISKMFILCFIVTIIFLLIKFILSTKKITITITVAAFFILSMIVFLSTNVGTALLVRTFGTKDGITLDRITSGRASIFGEYSSYILKNPLVLIFGKGPIFHDLSIFSTGEHNTFTVSIFGSGIIGVSLFLLILLVMSKNRFDKQNKLPNNVMFYSFLVCLFICFMSLGINPSTVFPIFVVAGHYININNIKKESIFYQTINI